MILAKMILYIHYEDIHNIFNLKHRMIVFARYAHCF